MVARNFLIDLPELNLREWIRKSSINRARGCSGGATGVEALRSEDMSNPLQVEQTYDAPFETVWDALTNESQMRQWYFPQLVRFEPVVGFDFEFENDGSAYRKAWRVTDVVAGAKLAHSWVYEGHPGRSEVTFELFAEGARTRLRVTHTASRAFRASHTSRGAGSKTGGSRSSP